MMAASSNHQLFDTPCRVSQSLRNDRCQNILYKAVFEHFIEIKSIAALLLTSKSFQNSSFGANFLVNFVVDEDSILVIDAVLSPSSCFSLQFVPSLHIEQSTRLYEEVNHTISNFIGELVKTKYLHLSLRSLTLHSVTNEVFSNLFGGNAWPHLHELKLERCRLNETILEAVSKNAVQLRTLNLSDNSEISNAVVGQIAKISTITSLNLANSNVGNAGLSHISKLSNIISLDLHGCNNISDVGLQHVAELSSITSLNVGYCWLISDFGIEFIAQLSTINSLNLFNCKITDVGLAIVSQLSNITALDIAACCEITDAGLEKVSALSQITSLNLDGCSKITDAGVEHIAKLGRITSLNLSRCRNLTDVGLQHVAHFSNITSLKLHNCVAITNAGFQQLCKLPSITFLDLSNCGLITDTGLRHLSKLANITSLDIRSCNKITAKAKKMHRAALPNCDIRG